MVSRKESGKNAGNSERCAEAMAREEQAIAAHTGDAIITKSPYAC
jgi:hypothetical protein